ncbi:ATP-dependent DNA helicase PIF1, partial [Diplonema papillatum]
MPYGGGGRGGGKRRRRLKMQGLPVAAASLRWCRLMRHQARGAKTSMAQTAFEPWTGPVMTADWQPRQAKPAQVLTHGQQGAVDAALRGENVFVGGGVGTGKTETLLHVKQALVRKFKSDEGIALLTAGTVVNPALGGFESSLRLVGNLPGVNENPAYAAEGEPSRLANAMAARADFWARLKVLIVDDVETADYDVWRSLRVVLTSLRRLAADPKKQFGEVQVIAAGDFCAVDQGAQATQHSNNYAFEDPEWSNTFTANFELEGTDGGSFAHEKQWARVLKDARFGIFSDELYSSLQARQVSAADPDSGLGIVESPPPATRSESGDTASNVHAYADPLAGRRFVDFDGTAPERDDAYIFRSLTPSSCPGGAHFNSLSQSVNAIHISGPYFHWVSTAEGATSGTA